MLNVRYSYDIRTLLIQYSYVCKGLSLIAYVSLLGTYTTYAYRPLNVYENTRKLSVWIFYLKCSHAIHVTQCLTVMNKWGISTILLWLIEGGWFPEALLFNALHGLSIKIAKTQNQPRNAIKLQSVMKWTYHTFN